ncbi:MAG: hypothetical protein NTV93_19370 [Verrucomicrobia bacterium]|nr:hypothetical protein [Verrucomicrobiota bacterium]
MCGPSFRRLVLVCVFLQAACPVFLRAQPAPAKPAVEFSCLVWEPLPLPAVYYRDGKSYLPLEFSPGNRSQIYPLKEGTDLELSVKELGADGAVVYKLVGKAPLVGGTRRMLFIIDPVPNSTGLPLRVFGVDDALAVFPPGTFRFLNFSTAALKIKFGGQTTNLPASEISVVKSNAPEKGGFLPFVIEDAKGKVAFETRLFGQPTGREMVFIGPPANPAGLPKVKFLTQIIPLEPPKPAATP